MKHPFSARVAARVLPIAMVAAASLHGAAQTPQASAPPPPPHYGTWGVDLTAHGPDGQSRRRLRPIRERRLEAGRPRSPPTRRPPASATTSSTCSQAQIRAIIDQRAGHEPARRHVPQLHERSRGRSADDKPLQADLKRVAAIADKDAFARFMGETSGALRPHALRPGRRRPIPCTPR